MKHLTRNEMKNLIGGVADPNGGGSFCVDCGDVRINGVVYHHNMMCRSVPAGGSCREYFNGGGVVCDNGNMTVTFSDCPLYVPPATAN